MSPWITGQRGMRSSETTWLPEEIELAPDWVRDEFVRLPEECRAWLDTQQPPSAADALPKRTRGRRGRHRKNAD